MKELEYISILSTELKNFKAKSNLWNFSCPFCGDSKRDKRKARGFLLPHKNKIFYKCHNCNLSLNFVTFLKMLDTNLHQKYLLETLAYNSDYQTKKEKIFEIPKIEKINALKISELNQEHEAVKWFHQRQLPEESKELFYYTDNFYQLAKDTFNNPKYENVPRDTRIIIPTYNQENQLVLIQGRSINSYHSLRYVTAKFADIKVQASFGLERIKYTETIYVVEGAFDSVFLPNCLAVSTSNLVSALKHIPQMYHDKIVFVHDNQPKNKEIVQQMNKSFQSGCSMVVFPSYITAKDLNEIHLQNYNVYDIIKENTFGGVELFLKLKQYSTLFI